jgi:hypothetical protein
VIGVVVGLIVTRRRGTRSPVDEPFDGDAPGDVARPEEGLQP